MSTKIKISIPNTAGEEGLLIADAVIAGAPADSVEVMTYDEDPQTTEEWIERTRDADAILLGWKIPDEAILAAENLKAISFFGTGIADQVSLPICEERGIATYNVSGYGDNAVAEHTIALLFTVWNQVSKLDAEVHSGGWSEPEREELRGSTLGIVGYGGIGKRVAELATLIGMNVKVWSRALEAGTKLAHGVAASLDEVLETSDAVSLHLALNPHTINFINADSFAKMKDGAILINTARGDVVNTDDLAAALKSGKLMGAGIDVFSSEPVPKDNPLIGLPGAVLTPHIGYNTTNAVTKLRALGIKNILDHFWSK